VPFSSNPRSILASIQGEYYNPKLILRRRLYMTDFRARGARQIFPCWDKPESKATFKISIRHPKNLVVISNMRTLSTNVQGNHMWTYLEVNRPISPYLITLTMHYRDFVSEHMSIKNVRMYYGKHTNLRDMQFAQLVIDHVIKNLRNTLKLLISWKSLNPNLQVAIIPKLIVHR
jgi:aminopeptidase N